jgi:hypothetical protein
MTLNTAIKATCDRPTHRKGLLSLQKINGADDGVGKRTRQNFDNRLYLLGKSAAERGFN